MIPMLRLALNNAIANRSRVALTALAVILSVAFMTATPILDSIDGTAAGDVAAANAGVDAVVEGAIIAEDDGGPDEAGVPTRQPLPEDALSIIDSTSGVADSAAVTSGSVKLVSNGVALGSGTAPDAGTAWIDNQELNPFTLADGSAPLSEPPFSPPPRQRTCWDQPTRHKSSSTPRQVPIPLLAASLAEAFPSAQVSTGADYIADQQAATRSA